MFFNCPITNSSVGLNSEVELKNGGGVAKTTT